MGFFDFLKKKEPPAPPPRSLPFRATVTALTPDGVGTLTHADGVTYRFGASACRGWQPAVGVEVEVNGLDAHPLGGQRALNITLVSDAATYSARFAETQAEFARQRPATAPLPVVPPVTRAPPPPLPPLKVPELDAPVPPGQRKLVTTRFENTRDGVIFFREVTWDGRVVRINAGRSSQQTPQVVDQTFQKSGEKFTTADEARAAFERHVTTEQGNFKTHATTVTFLPQLEGQAKHVSNPELEAAFEHAQPSAREAAAQVYADWLQGQGDLRGELAAQGPSFLERHASALLGEADAALGSELLDLKWSHGFLVGATLKRARYDSTTDLAKLTAEFLALPIARFVTELRFGLASFESDNDWTETLAAVANSPRGAAMTRLCFDDYTSEECEISWTPFGDFAPFWSKLPALEWLHIRSGAGGTLGALDLPNLKTFIRESGGLSEGELRSIIDAKWSKLERLDVWFGSDNYGAEGSVELIQPLLDRRGIERVTHLGFVNCEFSSELLVATVQSKVLKQLKVLDFSKGILGDADVEVLLKNVDRLKHLERLDLSQNLIEDVERVKAVLPNAVVDDQRDDDDGEYRYCAVGE